MTEHIVQNSFAERLLTWWDQHGRKDLPWQFNKTPYRVWVSEIMLQQTQVASVIGYYQRFMESFPSVQALAEAHEDSVLEHWAGLGYYARARNLHKAAKIINGEYQGEFPNTLDDITALPGIGRSTAGAILSIALNQRAPILDGNVKRVLCRHQAIRTWSGERQTEKHLWTLAAQFTPAERVDHYTQAIMDLGATLCTRSKPKCNECPMQNDCLAFEQDLQTELPVSKPKKSIPLKHTRVLHIQNEMGEILFEKRPPAGIWGGLYSLPEASVDTSLEDIKAMCSKEFNLKPESVVEQQSFVHTFSHYKLEIQPLLISAEQTAAKVSESDQYRWQSLGESNSIGLPAPIEKYLKQTVQSQLPLSVE